MSRIVSVFLATAVLAAPIVAPVQAQGLSDSFGPGRDAQGMFILRIPFGDPAVKRIEPEFGVQLGVSNRAERQYKTDRHEAKSGARIPGLDTEVIPTWRFESLGSEKDEDNRG
ncbi:MAG: hypothetical protein AAF495_00035 [Pseudomonadota bacterium]